MLIARPFTSAAIKLHPFDCGEPELNDWLACYASQSEKRDNVRTILLLDEQAQRVAGYFSMRTFELSAADNIGFEVIVVHALHEDAACFYLKHGFRRFVDHKLNLFLTTKELRATFASARPG